MGRRGKLEQVVPSIVMIGDRRLSKGPFSAGEWSQDVDVGDRQYKVTMRRGQRVRIAFKPAGKNWGYRWVADVWRRDARQGEHGNVWSGEVPKSLGVRGILLEARVVTTETKWWGEFVGVWFWIGAAIHAKVHPDCANPEDRRFGRTPLYDRLHVCQLTCSGALHLRETRAWGSRCPRCGVR